MKKRRVLLYCVAVLVCIGISPSRAAFEVQGVIVDEATHRPIPHATVTLDGKPQYADANGSFASAGTVRIVAARAPGYRSASVSLKPDQPLVVSLTPFRARGVYLSLYGVATPSLRNAAVALKETNGINALVIDAKGDRGLTSYASEARESIGAAANAPSPAPVVRDMAGLLESLHREGLYLIARIHAPPRIPNGPFEMHKRMSGGIVKSCSGSIHSGMKSGSTTSTLRKKRPVSASTKSSSTMCASPMHRG